jgi:quinol-cytochrome oxidoreductase complex cytochrome b subunit
LEVKCLGQAYRINELGPDPRLLPFPAYYRHFTSLGILVFHSFIHPIFTELLLMPKYSHDSQRLVRRGFKSGHTTKYIIEIR